MSDSQAVSIRPLWQQQLAQAITSPEQLGELLQLPASWVAQHREARRLFPLRVTPHFVKLMQPGDCNDPLLLQVMPHHNEFTEHPEFTKDPLAEQSNTQPGILHKYKSRVLVILKGGCAINCRYCFRRHFPYQQHSFGKSELAGLVATIASDTNINEVILSGGDPLLATDEKLDEILTTLEQLPQLRRIRIHSRLPVVLPTRLTNRLAERLARSHLQAILVLHINHPREVAEELIAAARAWHQAGVTLLNQSVLLKGINDSATCLSELSEKLFAANIMPYYLHQLDKVAGASHFAVTDEAALKLYQQLLAELPGFLVPKLVREIAGEASKTPL